MCSFTSAMRTLSRRTPSESYRASTMRIKRSSITSEVDSVPFRCWLSGNSTTSSPCRAKMGAARTGNVHCSFEDGSATGSTVSAPASESAGDSAGAASPVSSTLSLSEGVVSSTDSSLDAVGSASAFVSACASCSSAGHANESSSSMKRPWPYSPIK